MSIATRQRIVNPRLGTYFSIFASLFVAVFLLTLIFEQLRIENHLLQIACFAVPLVLYGAIGLSVATRDTMGFFAAGRRVPAAYSGLVLALSSLGGTVIVAGSGAFFFAGFDALVLMTGMLTGFVVMAVAVAPFYRKFGAYTVPSYFGRRFDSKALRVTAALVATVPMLLVLAAELKIGGVIAAQLTGWDASLLTAVLALFVGISLTPGGTRSFTWVAVAQAIGAVVALVIAATAVSMLVTSLPVPQLANGPLVRGLVRQEVGQGLQVVSVWPLAFGLPGEGLQAITKPYTQPFGAVGPLAFMLASISIAAGIASAPWLLPRTSVAPGVYEARKSLGWATVFAGFVILTLSSTAIFMRDFVLDAVMNDRIGPLPEWLDAVRALGFAAYNDGLPRLDFTQLKFDRDSVLFALPVAAGLPLAFVYLIMTGALAAALVAIGATAVTLGAVFGEDILQGLSWEPASKENRIWISRGSILVAALSGFVLTVLAPADPLQMVFWALGLTGASFFPVLILSIWWKRLTTAGAVAGIVGGFITGGAAIIAGEGGSFSVPSAIAASAGLPVSLVLALVVSALRPSASRHILEVVRDMRVPGGQIIYDRDMQRLTIKRQTRS